MHTRNRGDGTITFAFFFVSSTSSFFFFFFVVFFFFISFVHRSTAAADPVIRFSTEHFVKTDFSIRKCREGYSAGLRNAWEWNKNNVGEEFTVLWAVFLYSFSLDFFSIFLFFYFFYFFFFYFYYLSKLALFCPIYTFRVFAACTPRFLRRRPVPRRILLYADRISGYSSHGINGRRPLKNYSYRNIS